MPIVGPEEQHAQRGRQISAAHTRAHAHEVTTPVELRLDDYRPAIHFAEIGQSLLQRRKTLSVAAAHVAHHVSIAYRVIGKLAPQSEIDNRSVERSEEHTSEL